MSKPYDVTMKHLLEVYAGDWLSLVKVPVTGRFEVIDADLATVTSEADNVFRLSGPPDWLLHFEIQSGYDQALPKRCLRYNVLLDGHHELPVRTVLVLLRREADGFGSAPPRGGRAGGRRQVAAAAA